MSLVGQFLTGTAVAGAYLSAVAVLYVIIKSNR
jgi:hypothetical protein